MDLLSQQRCLNHGVREAVAGVPNAASIFAGNALPNMTTG